MSAEARQPVLPQDLGQGLILRQARPDDVETLAHFNGQVFREEAQTFNESLATWTRCLLSGKHPTTAATDFTVVVDTRAGNRIVSSIGLISQTWTYAGIAFGVGRPELVATDPDYRRRGLIGRQMAVHHAWSAARGQRLQAITGIPSFYRRYGYEMALDLSGRRRLDWSDLPAPGEAGARTYRLRPAELGDQPVLARLYQNLMQTGLVARQRSPAEWHYELAGTLPGADDERKFHVIEHRPPEGEGPWTPVGYLEAQPKTWALGPVVREVAIQPGHSWRTALLFTARQWLEKRESLEETWGKRSVGVTFELGSSHPAYEALGQLLGFRRPPYAWYLRLPDLAGFLSLVRPVLEQRLAASVLAGHSGELQLNFYGTGLQLGFSEGRIQTIRPYEPSRYEEGDAAFPGRTFLQLLFGHRRLAELRQVFPDCYARDEATVLLDCLFPRLPSWVAPL